MQGKRIILGVGGGIAAYKVADLASKLTQNGALVHAVLTQSAQNFIAPLTFTALTHHLARTSLWENSPDGSSAGMPHIELADAADLVVVAPASADLIARLASGLGDELLTTLVLATRAPVAVAPAMNPQMLAHPATQRNLQTLRDFGFHILEPQTGRMACEHFGAGRLPETDEFLLQISALLKKPEPILSGKVVVVTAGPTRENLDPVRFLSNRSSGKMGYALAEIAAQMGAQVTLVSGPTALPVPRGVQRKEVISALEMQSATLEAFENADFLVAAAAPSDFRAQNTTSQKIKRGDQTLFSLHLVANPDIVAQCGARKNAQQKVVGFAAETENLLDNAREKLTRKNLDAIVANDVSNARTGFDAEENEAVFLSLRGETFIPRAPKIEVAHTIWRLIAAI